MDLESIFLNKNDTLYDYETESALLNHYKQR